MANVFPHQPDLKFRKSSYSDRNNCVEVADLANGAAVRDSQQPESGYLAFPSHEVVAFITSTKRDTL
ncbi:DUF397 domain-containing protein [Nocardiopsis gilva YIM 90087]|uniref:DUF397 domain-containing protein n=1 Tax=Nocardiopsis gilva YIM 90087 TaxID=1235441 RepID=A0A223S0P9_9ACTN|nr:DUF397 domain-containing protein [Nocardiopsis gilva]ASU81696.1 DUF397 domain-containing protein [Nocardiopsis gilva YIM 90087]